MQEIIINIMEVYGYLGILLLICIENIFPPIPSEVILTFGGFMTNYTSLNVPFVIIASTIGAILGALILYYAGSILNKDRLIKIITSKYGKLLRLKPKDIENANDWFNKKGTKTVFFCRFIPIVRSLISIPAGMNKMKISSFLFYTLLGTLIWNTVLVVLGSIVGEKWPIIVSILNKYSKITLIILIIMFISFIVWYYSTRIKKENKS